MPRSRSPLAGRLARRRTATETAPAARTLPPGQTLHDVLPLPPLELRELVGPTDPQYFDQPAGTPVFPQVTSEQFASVLDFGCGCGRIARRIALAAAPMPERYLGLDLHRGMIRWNNENLAPWLENFSFEHHDVYNLSFNPGGDPSGTRAFPSRDESVTLMLAWSVFTHLVQDQAEHYLSEVARTLAPGGLLMSTWFLFEKPGFPMMQDFQQALYINPLDPTNAVIFDREWLLGALEQRGLRIRAATPPDVRGYQWTLEIERGHGSVELPPDEGVFSRVPPPLGRPGADRLGLQ